MSKSATDKKPNLFDRGVNAVMRRPSWMPGDKEVIWYDHKTFVRAYVQEAGGKIDLRLSNHDLAVTLFEEDPVTNFFDLTETAREDYEAWSMRVMADLKRETKPEAPAKPGFKSERRDTVDAVFARWYPQLANEIDQITIVEVRPAIKKAALPKKYPRASAHRGHS